MPRTISQSIRFRASPERLYRLYLNAREHAAACGGWGRARITARVGGRMEMAPYITGRFLLLVPGKMIVQTWRGANWKKSDLDSVLVLTFHRIREGARLAMLHANVAAAHARSIGSATGGWHSHYWRPWKAYLRKKRSR